MNNPFQSIDCGGFLQLSKEQLAHFFLEQSQFCSGLSKENLELKACIKGLEDQLLLINNQVVLLKHKLYGSSSERTGKKDPKPRKDTRSSKRCRVKLRPSERYPDAPLIETDVAFKELPECGCCGGMMQDSGMTEDSELLDIIPAQFRVIVQKRHKYRCTHCHGSMKTAPVPPRITPGGSYSDEMIIDVAMAKYCDLIPVERYCNMAGRGGFEDLPANSLIGVTHTLANLVEPAYEKIRDEVLSAEVLHADETPHKMMEGDEKKNWYLWGFSTPESSYFDIRDSRSGDVAMEILNNARCKYLVSDVFSGYRKAVRESNKIRVANGQAVIKNVYCNSHARRKFKEAEKKFPEVTSFFIDKYQLIYELEKEFQLTEGPPDLRLKKRSEMRKFFEDMKEMAERLREQYSSKSTMYTACNYFLKNYKNLMLFLDNAELPIDNNHQERLLRNPVIGRKTWYGTHSKRGARTAAIIFSLVESCKLNKINPRMYFKNLVADLLQKQAAFTPREFKNM